MSKVAELEDALQRERVDKVERLQVMQRMMPTCASVILHLVFTMVAACALTHLPLQMLQSEAEGEIGRLTSELQQLQVSGMVKQRI